MLVARQDAYTHVHPRRRDELQVLFRAACEPGQEVINYSGLYSILLAIEPKVTKDAALRAIALLDANGSGLIEWDEFINVFSAKETASIDIDDLQQRHTCQRLKSKTDAPDRLNFMPLQSPLRQSENLSPLCEVWNPTTTSPKHGTSTSQCQCVHCGCPDLHKRLEQAEAELRLLRGKQREPGRHGGPNGTVRASSLYARSMSESSAESAAQSSGPRSNMLRRLLGRPRRVKDEG